MRLRRASCCLLAVRLRLLGNRFSGISNAVKMEATSVGTLVTLPIAFYELPLNQAISWNIPSIYCVALFCSHEKTCVFYSHNG